MAFDAWCCSGRDAEINGQVTYEIKSEINEELLRRNRICYGIKGKGLRYRCGEEVKDPGLIKEVTTLLIEAINRLIGLRVWDAYWIDNNKREWEIIKERAASLKDKYGDAVDKLLTVIDEVISYVNEFKDYWIKYVSGEVRDLIKAVISGKAKIILGKSLEPTIRVYGRHVIIHIGKVNGAVTIKIVLSNISGVVINVPNIFSLLAPNKRYEDLIRDLTALRAGFTVSDEGISKGKPYMVTTQPWQALFWAMLYPGEVYVRIPSVNVNADSITIVWWLRTDNYSSLKKSVFKIVRKCFDDGQLMEFLFTAILGDGSAKNYVYRGVKRPFIMISTKKYKRWKAILRKIGLRHWEPNTNQHGVVMITYCCSNAIELARRIVNALPPEVQDLLDALNVDKWVEIKQIAQQEIKWRPGEMKMMVFGIELSLHVISKNSMELIYYTFDGDEANIIYNELKSMLKDIVDGEPCRIRQYGKRYEVVITWATLKVLVARNCDIRMQIIQVLRRRHENVKSNEQKWKIAHALNEIMKIAPTDENCPQIV